MRRPSFLLALLLLAAAPAAAQPERLVRPGQTVTGRLAPGDYNMDDGSWFDVWEFDAQPLHVYRITMRSSRVDALLAVGMGVGSGSCEGCRTNDDGAGGNDAAVRFAPFVAGRYQIRANSFNPGETGAYEITLEDEGLAPAADPAVPVTLTAGDTVRGRLEPGDALQGSDYEDTYVYHARADETVVVTLRSADFDAVVAMGLPGHRGCRPIDWDNDGGGGTDSKLKVTAEQDGIYHVHVRTGTPGGRGAYTLLLERP